MKNKLLNGRSVIIKPQSLVGIFTGISVEHKHLSDWPPFIQGMGIVITDHCDLSCPHCYNSSSPSRGTYLEKDKIISACNIIMQDQPGFRAVSLSGGEPLLHPEINNIVSELSNLGIVVSCVTGGGGVSPNRIRNLSTAGLENLAISFDAFHNRFISEDDIKSLVIAATECISHVTIKFCVQTYSEYLHAIENWDSLVEKNVTFEFYGLTPFGRAKRNFRSSNDPFTDVAQPLNCAQEFGIISMNSDGFIYPCCSTGGFSDGLALCHVNEVIEKKGINAFYSEREDLRDIALTDWELMPGTSKCQTCNNNCGSRSGEYQLTTHQ